MACWWNKNFFWKPFALCFFCNTNNKYIPLICGHVTNNTCISSLGIQSTPRTTANETWCLRLNASHIDKWKAKTSSNFFKRHQCRFFFSSSQFCVSAKPQLCPEYDVNDALEQKNEVLPHLELNLWGCFFSLLIMHEADTRPCIYFREGISGCLVCWAKRGTSTCWQRTEHRTWGTRRLKKAWLCPKKWGGNKYR